MENGLSNDVGEMLVEGASEDDVDHLSPATDTECGQASGNNFRGKLDLRRVPFVVDSVKGLMSRTTGEFWIEIPATGKDEAVDLSQPSLPLSFPWGQEERNCACSTHGVDVLSRKREMVFFIPAVHCDADHGRIHDAARVLALAVLIIDLLPTELS